MLDHAEGVASLSARAAIEFVHQRPHQKNAAAPDAHLGGIQIGDRS